LIPVWRDDCLVSGDPPGPVTALDEGRSQAVREAGTPLFLGMDGDVSVFAASGRPLGRVDSIDRHLLQSWLNQQ
jgi:hypothetical protein